MEKITLYIILIIAFIAFVNTTSKTVIAEENHSIYPIPAGLSGVVVEPKIEQDTHEWLVMYCNQMLGTSEECK